MKTCAAAVLLFLCSFLPAFSQPKQCYAYDYLKAEKLIWNYLFKGDNFEYISDDVSGREIFDTKQKLRSKGKVIPIPVLYFNYEKVSDQSSSPQINALFSPDYSVYTAFLMNADELQNLIFSSPGYQHPSFKRIENMVPADPNTAKSIYSLYKQEKICFFYDDSRGRYAYFKDNAYVYFNDETKVFSTLSAKEYIEDYQRYYHYRLSQSPKK